MWEWLQRFWNRLKDLVGLENPPSSEKSKQESPFMSTSTVVGHSVEKQTLQDLQNLQKATQEAQKQLKTIPSIQDQYHQITDPKEKIAFLVTLIATVYADDETIRTFLRNPESIHDDPTNLISNRKIDHRVSSDYNLYQWVEDRNQKGQHHFEIKLAIGTKEQFINSPLANTSHFRCIQDKSFVLKLIEQNRTQLVQELQSMKQQSTSATSSENRQQPMSVSSS